MKKNFSENNNDYVLRDEISTRPVYQTSLPGIALMLIAIALIIFSLKLSHKVYNKATEEFGILAYDEISEKQLVIDGTFSGTLRDKKTGRLYSTYDRTQPVGKKACPT